MRNLDTLLPFPRQTSPMKLLTEQCEDVSRYRGLTPTGSERVGRERPMAARREYSHLVGRVRREVRGGGG